MTSRDGRGEDARLGRAGSERAVHGALDAMRQILQEVRVANRAVEQQLGLSGAQLFVLEELAREPAASLNELAARTATRHSSVSTVVARLGEAGLVTRQAAPEDGRRVQLDVTARARRLLKDAPPSAQARLLAAAAVLPPTQLGGLSEGLSAWCASFLHTRPAAGNGRPAAATPRLVRAGARGRR